MEKRLLVIANLGFIIGIIVGLYLRLSIILFLSIFVANLFLFLIYQNLFKKGFRYIKVYITKKVMLIFIVFLIIGAVFSILKNNSFNQFYYNMQLFSTNTIKVQAVIVEEREEKEYSDVYKIKILSVNNKKYFNTYCILTLGKIKNKQLDYGDKIYFLAEYLDPKDTSNFKGYSYKEYLKTINIYGTFKSKYKDVKVLEKNGYGMIYMLSNSAKNSFKRSVG